MVLPVASVFHSISSLVLIVCFAPNLFSVVEAVHQDVKRHENAARTDRGGMASDSSDQVDDDRGDDGDDDDDSDDPRSLLSTNDRQTPTVQNNWNAALENQKKKGVGTFISSKPIKVHWLWHQSMCLEADTSINIHHQRNMHLAECRNPTPAAQRFDYMPSTYQIRLHHNGGKYCLDRDGDNLIFNTCKTQNVGSQRFVFDAGTDHIRNAAAAGGVKCLSIEAGMARHGDLYVNGTNVALKQCIASETDQKFKPANLLDIAVLNKTIAEVVTVEAGTSLQEQQARARQSAPKPVAKVAPATMPLQPFYYPVPQPIPQYYQPPLYPPVAYPQYAEYQNPMNLMNPMMPVGMQQVTQGGMAIAPTVASAPPQVAPANMKAAAAQQGAQTTPTIDKSHKVVASSLVSIAHASPAHASAHSSTQDMIDIASSKLLKKASNSLPSSSSSIGDATFNPSAANSDQSTSHSMFGDLDHILDPAKNNAEHSLNELSAIPAGLPWPAQTSDLKKPQTSSINDILGDLNKAGKDMGVMDQPGKEMVSFGGGDLSSQSLLETKRVVSDKEPQYSQKSSLEVGPGALLRRT